MFGNETFMQSNTKFDWNLHVLLNIDQLTKPGIQTQFQQVSKLVWSWNVHQPRGIYRVIEMY